MSKVDLIDVVARETHISKVVAKKVLDTFIETVGKELQAKPKIILGTSSG